MRPWASLIGAVFGLLIGGAVVWAINQSATTLKSTSIGVNGTASEAWRRFSVWRNSRR